MADKLIDLRGPEGEKWAADGAQAIAMVAAKIINGEGPGSVLREEDRIPGAVAVIAMGNVLAQMLAFGSDMKDFQQFNQQALAAVRDILRRRPELQELMKEVDEVINKGKAEAKDEHARIKDEF